ncbi:MAG: GNAT family N-acetyltransferase [Planctomycetota bacterium]
MKPLTLDIPLQFETERLVLRRPELKDVDVIHGSALAAMPALAEWMPWAELDMPRSVADEWVREVLGRWYGRTELAYMILRDGRHIGNTSVFALDWDVPRGEIGYWLRNDARGQGLMTEALAGFRDLLAERLGFQRVDLRIEEPNAPSRAVAERAGFTCEATMRRYGKFADGRFQHMCMYAWTLQESDR